MFKMIKIELRNIIKDKFLLFMYFVAPLIVGGFVYSTISQSIIHKIPIGILDLDNTKTSRDTIFDINSSSIVDVNKSYSNILEAQEDLSVKNIYALVIFPKNFESDIKRHVIPDVSIYYNTQLVLVGKNIKNALTLVFKNKDINLTFARNIINTKNTSLALFASINFMPQIISLYNPNSSFSQFLLTVIIPCSWQLFIILCMINLIAQNNINLSTNSIQNYYKHFGIKILINTIIFFIWWIIMDIVFYNLGYPNNGNIWILSLNALIAILAYNSVGIFLYAMVKNHTRAISIAAFYAAPSLAFVGITYPINSMELFPTFWSYLLPITKYIQVYIQQENYGADIFYSLKLIMQNLPFLLFGILGLIIYRKKNSKC